MKVLFTLTTLFISQVTFGFQPYWTEELPNGTRQACASHSFWDTFTGKKNCVPYKGDTPPDASTILTQTSPAVPESDKKLYKDVADFSAFAKKDIQEQTKAVNSLEQEVKRLQNPGTTKCEGTLEEQQNCFERGLQNTSKLKGEISKKTTDLETTKSYIEGAQKELNAALAVKSNIERKSFLGNEILKASNMLLNVNNLENKVDDAKETLSIIEKSLNDSLLEAYFLAKMKKLAGNLCEAQRQCSESKDKAANTLLNGVLDESRIMKSLEAKKTTGSVQK